jgi:hypothetical protein
VRGISLGVGSTGAGDIAVGAGGTGARGRRLGAGGLTAGGGGVTTGGAGRGGWASTNSMATVLEGCLTNRAGSRVGGGATKSPTCRAALAVMAKARLAPEAFTLGLSLLTPSPPSRPFCLPSWLEEVCGCYEAKGVDSDRAAARG